MAEEHSRTTLHAEVDRAAELARLRDVERVALEFCERCERGEECTGCRADRHARPVDAAQLLDARMHVHERLPRRGRVEQRVT